MLIQSTLEKMRAMKLSALAEAFEEQVGILIDTERTARENRKLARRLKAAKMHDSALP